MKNRSKQSSIRFLSALLAVLMMAFCMPFSAYAEEDPSPSFTDDEECSVRLTYLDGNLSSPCFAYRDTIWINFSDLYTGLAGFCEITRNEDESLTLRGPELKMLVSPLGYLCINNRYVYLPFGYLVDDSGFYLDVETVSSLLCMEIQIGFDRVDLYSHEWSLPENGIVFYRRFSAEDIYWLSHIIHAESGHSPLIGRLAVGNVVMNRVFSDRFPNSIYEVVFDNQFAPQFQPALEGTVNETPDECSVIAAYLALEGYCVVDDALYFFEPFVKTPWLDENDFVCKIGYHLFYR